MRKWVLLAAAALLVGTSNVSNAVPVQYDLSFTATLGPSGVGSFVFDEATGLITDFSWDFGGVTGGLLDSNFTPLAFGDTLGRFVFEILSQTDVHPFVNCVGNGCGSGFTIDVGSGPLGSTGVGFGFDPIASEVIYQFAVAPDPADVARGTIDLARASIPEPGVLLLIGLGLAGLAFSHRKRKV